MTIELKALQPFAKGGNRLCYVHPDHPDRCIKVRRPDFSLEKRRQRKGFPKNLKPLSSFDDNREEYKVMKQLNRFFGNDLYAHVSRCYGFEDTDLGKGLTSELIRDYDGRISKTLKHCIWEHGYNDEIKRAVTKFSNLWAAIGIPSRDLLLHNLVVQMADETTIKRLVLIDGLGSPNILPLDFLFPWIRHKKAHKKTTNLHARIAQLVNQRSDSEFPGYHGKLLHDGTGKDLTK